MQLQLLRHLNLIKIRKIINFLVQSSHIIGRLKQVTLLNRLSSLSLKSGSRLIRLIISWVVAGLSADNSTKDTVVRRSEDMRLRINGHVVNACMG